MMVRTDECQTLTIKEAASLLGISRNAAYLQAREGTLAGVKLIRVGARVLVPKEAFERVLSGG